MKTINQPPLYTLAYANLFIYLAVAVHFAGELMKALKASPQYGGKLLSFCWDKIKDGGMTAVKWLVDHRWRGTRVGYVKDMGTIFINFAPHPKRKVMEITFQWHSPWKKATRWLGFYYCKDSWPTCNEIFGYCIPFLFGCRIEIHYNVDWWKRKYGVGYPRHYTEYSFTLNDQHVVYVHGDYMDHRSFDIPWAKKLRKIFFDKKGIVKEPGDWYSAIIPIPAAGAFVSETIKARCKRIEVETVTRKLWFKTRQYETLWTVDLGDGVVVPADYNVYEDQLSTGVTLKDVGCHQEAIQKVVASIVMKRKCRSKTARSMQQ